MQTDYRGKPLKPWQVQAMKAGPKLARKALQGTKPYNGREYIDGKITPEYRAWESMKARCYNSNTKNFHIWGGRGIRVCQKWLGSYMAFLQDVGRRPSPNHSLDRYPDPDGNYRPGNVRWATWEQQANNRSWRVARIRSEKLRSSQKNRKNKNFSLQKT